MATSTAFPPSELIINPDGSIYHLGLLPEHLGDYILTVGDPDRVGMVSKYLDAITFRSHRREFVAHVGRLGNRQITVMSTGMGTDNIEIVMNELDALANIDFATRSVRPTLRSLNVIRLGTSGALQHEIELGSTLISAQAIGMDSLMAYYQLEQDDMAQMLTTDLRRHLGIGFQPYMAKASSNLLEMFPTMPLGITLTCPGFYAPQGRQLRAPVQNLDLIQFYKTFVYQGLRITNFEMETAGYYSMGQMLGHQVLSINAIVAHRLSNQFAADPMQVVDNMIRQVMQRLADAPVPVIS